MAKSPTTPGKAPSQAAPAPFTGSASSSTSSSVLSPSMLGARGPAGPSPFAASELAKQTASQMAGQNVTNHHFGGTQAIRALGLDPRAGSVSGSAGAGGVGAKMGEFNFGMTPDPSTKPDKKTPKGDNGRRVMGTSFDDPPGSQADINNAFNDLSIPKNHDCLNEAGQAEVGSP